MDRHKYGIEDILDLTDSESSSSSDAGLFDNHRPLVLELHELKDEPKMENENQYPKLNKHKKKKKSHSQKSHISMSSDSQSEGGSLPPTLDTNDEEFYDAHESYHTLSDNQLPKEVTTVGLLQAHSEHGREPKDSPGSATSPSIQQTPAAPKKTSTVSVQSLLPKFPHQ